MEIFRKFGRTKGEGVRRSLVNRKQARAKNFISPYQPSYLSIACQLTYSLDRQWQQVHTTPPPGHHNCPMCHARRRHQICLLLQYSIHKARD